MSYMVAKLAFFYLMYFLLDQKVPKSQDLLFEEKFTSHWLQKTELAMLGQRFLFNANVSVNSFSPQKDRSF